jgi:hypothetical protein
MWELQASQNVTADGHNFDGMDGFEYLGLKLVRVANQKWCNTD